MLHVILKDNGYYEDEVWKVLEGPMGYDALYAEFLSGLESRQENFAPNHDPAFEYTAYRVPGEDLFCGEHAPALKVPFVEWLMQTKGFREVPYKVQAIG